MSESLGLILIKAGVISPRDLIDAHTRGGSEPLARRLVALGMVTEEQIQRAVAAHIEARSKPPMAPRVRPSLRPVARKLRLQ
jgi:hypothetical protein